MEKAEKKAAPALDPAMAKKPIFQPPKYYAHICEEMPPTYSDYMKSFELIYGVADKYEIIKKVGRGKYSDVYEGVRTDDDAKVCIKILKPIKKEKIKREVKILQTLKDCPGIVQLLEVVRDPATKTPSLIFEYIDTGDMDFRTLSKKFTPTDVKFYIAEILKALDFAHSKGIIHRDVKSHNILIDPLKKQLKLIDWGLAEFYHLGIPNNTRVASRYYKGPELLVDYGYYDYSLDIWSLGCLFAALIFQQDPFFQGKDNNDQLVKIVRTLGTDEFYEYLQQYGIVLDPNLAELIGKHSKKPWKRFKTAFNEQFCSNEAIDLLSQMLVFDHAKRITAKDALKHPYFSVAKEVKKGSDGQKEGA